MGVYEEISSNRRKSFFLIFIFVVFIIFLGYLFGEFTGFGLFGPIFAFIIVFFIIIFQYYKGDKLILRMSKATPVKRREHPHLVNTVEGLAIAAGVPTPKIYIIDDTAPNAFATGRNPEHASIAVTKGLVQKMKRAELEGVIAHEMSHIKNYDIKYMMLVAVMVGVVIFLSDWMLRMAFFGGGRRGKGSGIIIIIALAMAIIAPLVAYLIRFSMSRKREFLADASGALLTRYPEGLASALEKISKDKEALEVANRGTEHLYIINPLKKARLRGLFSTHPPLKERVRRLREM